MCVCVCVCVCARMRAYVHACVYVCVCMLTDMHVSFCLFVCDIVYTRVFKNCYCTVENMACICKVNPRMSEHIHECKNCAHDTLQHLLLHRCT